jgi:hypothetical protein
VTNIRVIKTMSGEIGYVFEDREVGPQLPETELAALPRFIFDTLRKMLWELESDGNYGLLAAADPMDVSDVRRSVTDLQAAHGEFLPLVPDRRPRDGSWRLVDGEQVGRGAV